MAADTAKKCFVIMPISTPSERLDLYDDDADHFVKVYSEIFVPAVKKAGFEAIGPMAEGSEAIHQRIIENLQTAEMVLCDMSCLNPNVFFELGVRTALNLPVAFVKDNVGNAQIPFDVGPINCLTYTAVPKWNSISEEITAVADHVKATGRQENSLWRLFAMEHQAERKFAPVTHEDKLDRVLDLLGNLTAQNALLPQGRKVFVANHGSFAEPLADIMPRDYYLEIERASATQDPDLKRFHLLRAARIAENAGDSQRASSHQRQAAHLLTERQRGGE